MEAGEDPYPITFCERVPSRVYEEEKKSGAETALAGNKLSFWYVFLAYSDFEVCKWSFLSNSNLFKKNFYLTKARAEVSQILFKDHKIEKVEKFPNAISKKLVVAFY